MSAGQDGDGVEAAADWTDEHRFAVILEVPALRDAVATCAAATKLPMSAEQFLAIAAAIPLRGFSALPQSAARGRAFALKRGWHTGKSREEQIPGPVGLVIATVLCSMAYHGQSVRSVEQRENGCTLIAEIPSDFKTFGGILQVSIERGDDRRTIVQATAKIPGQLYDWGKSNQTIAALFADILSLPESKMAAAGVPAALTARNDNS